jgi:hypothetical protein
MPALATVWALAKGLPWKWVAAALFVAGLLSAYGHREYGRGSHSRDAEVSGLTAQRDGYKANQDTLTAALNRQNAAVAALKADGDKRVADGKTALAKAKRENAGLSDQANALRKSAGRKIGADDPCVISNTLGNMGAI